MPDARDRFFRLCVLSHSCVIATNQTLWARLAHDWPVDLTLLAPKAWGGLGGGSVRVQVAEGLEGRVSPLRVIPQGHPNLHLWLGLGTELRRLAPDCLFLDEEPYSLAAAQVLLSGWARRAALVVYAKQNILKRHPWPLGAVERKVLAAAEGLVAVDAAAEEVLWAKGARAPVTVIPHAIDQALYSPGDATALRERLGLRGFVVGYAGRLVAEKGVADLLEAVIGLAGQAQRTAPREPGDDGLGQPDLSLLIVGDGPEREALRARAEAALPGRVVFTGAVPHERVAEYYRCMDVLVLPSRTGQHWREQFGRTIIEALACGVPVVGSDSGAVPATLSLTAGLSYPEGKVSALAELLARLAASPGERAALAEKGRRRVLESFTTEAVAQALYAVAQEAVERRKKR